MPDTPNDPQIPFTREDVQMLRDIASACAKADESRDYYTAGMVPTCEIGDVSGLASRIAALLPSTP